MLFALFLFHEVHLPEINRIIEEVKMCQLKVKKYQRGTFINEIKENDMKQRMIESLIGGVLLGLVCVVGASVRSGFTASPTFIFSLWYNRVILGLVIGAPWEKSTRLISLARGALFGLLVSFAFYSSTGFSDPISFVAGVIYGVILEFWLFNRGY